MIVIVTYYYCTIDYWLVIISGQYNLTQQFWHMCMYIYIYINLYVHVSIHIYILIFIFRYIYIYLYMNIPEDYSKYTHLIYLIFMMKYSVSYCSPCE
jgi:hypothetical protein